MGQPDVEAETTTDGLNVLLGFGLDAPPQDTEYLGSWARAHPERALTQLEKVELVARTLETAVGSQVESGAVAGAPPPTLGSADGADDPLHGHRRTSG